MLKRLPFVYTGIWGIITVSHILVVWLVYQQQPIHATADGLLFNGTFALLGVGLWYMVRYSDLSRRSWLELLFVHISAATGVMLIWLLPVSFILKGMLRSDPDYLLFMEETMPGRVIVGVGLYIAIVTMAYLIINLRRLRDQMLKEAELQTLLKETELSMLRFQINPHFLFNSLNAISSLIVTRPEEANSMVVKLADFMRYSLDAKGDVMSTFGKETAQCGVYLDIEKVRYGERLKVELQVEEGAAVWPVPSMVLQPLVENAVKHGLEETDAGMLITVAARLEPNALEIVVRNPYDPHTRSGKRGTGTGLKNISARLQNLYGRNDLMAIRREGGWFEVQLTIPEHGRKIQMPDR